MAWTIIILFMVFMKYLQFSKSLIGKHPVLTLGIVTDEDKIEDISKLLEYWHLED